MVNRMTYRAQVKKGCEQQAKAQIEAVRPQIEKLIADGRLMTLSVFQFRRNLFFYYECIGEEMCACELFASLADLLETFAGEEEPRHFVRMYDIFHYNRPADVEGWRRKTRPENSFAQVLRLKPEKLSSYIFQHYRYQEEIPGDGDKFGSIWLNENFMFFYLEMPTVVEKATWDGELKTHDTPHDTWSSVMEPHFLPWEDGSLWTPTELLLYV